MGRTGIQLETSPRKPTNSTTYFLLPEEPNKEHDEENDEEKNDHHTQQITATHGQCTYSYQYESIQEENFYDTHDGLLEGELAELRNSTKDHQQQHNHELPQHKDPTKPFKTCWKSEYSSNGRFEITADWKIRRWNLLQPNSQLHL